MEDVEQGRRTRDLLLCELGKVVHLPLVPVASSKISKHATASKRPIRFRTETHGAPLPCQKNSHCNAWLLSNSSLNPNTSSLSANFNRYKSSADVSMTGKGGD